MGKAKFADIWLVRAGCTQWDQDGRIVGATDLPPCEAGVEHARSAATEFTGKPICAILTAPSECARATADLIARAAGRPKVKPTDTLAEIALGLWEGTLAADIEDRCPTVYRQWKSDPSSVIPPEGEAFDDAMSRVREAVDDAVDRYIKNGQGLAIVVGPTVFGMLICWLENHPPSDLWHLLDVSPSVIRMTVDRATMKAVSRSVSPAPEGTTRRSVARSVPSIHR